MRQEGEKATVVFSIVLKKKKLLVKKKTCNISFQYQTSNLLILTTELYHNFQ